MPGVRNKEILNLLVTGRAKQGVRQESEKKNGCDVKGNLTPLALFPSWNAHFVSPEK
jgi:hypothetical protein